VHRCQNCLILVGLGSGVWYVIKNHLFSSRETQMTLFSRTHIGSSS
jgi:hypothetical protein